MIKFFRFFECGYASLCPENVYVAQGKKNIKETEDVIDRMISMYSKEDPDVIAEKIMQKLDILGIAKNIEDNSYNVYL